MSTIINPESPITEIKGIGPKKSEAFRKLGIETIKDLIRFYPREYEDLRNIKTISKLADGEKAVVEAVIQSSVPGKGYGRKRNLHLTVIDKTGSMDIIFFMAGFMLSEFRRGESYRFFGKVKREGSRIVMFQPSYFKADSVQDLSIRPVYPLCKGVSQNDIKKCVSYSLDLLNPGDETLPVSIIKQANLCPLKYALTNIHFPADEAAFSAAKYRLVFEELFDLRVALKLSADRFGSGRDGISFANGSFNEFINSLSYSLTEAQKRVLKEIEMDMNSTRSMSRLLQGDVGSGKTIVAEAAVCKAVNAGYQAVFMAPTEILAKQQFDSFTDDFKNLGFTIRFLSSSVSLKARRCIISEIADGTCNILVGTHAVISKDVEFKNLGIAVTDEQHRFGVNQRKMLNQKGNNPDVLVMTATPIPRTLAVVLYSDLDISIIDELPPGRMQIITKSCDSNHRKQAYDFLVSQVKTGRQAYIITPFIEDSEYFDAKSAEGLFEEFTSKYPYIRASLLHGAMKADEKNRIMSDFADGNISVLISTVVIEVGINIPNSTVMLIENCERFGLAQLHQLRGRVGRGKHQSYCILVTGEESELSKERCRIMTESGDGFVIAEKDLELRGPGELFGYRQHGLPQMSLADPVKHIKLAEIAGNMADNLLNSDHDLTAAENIAFGNRIRRDFGNGENLIL